MEDDHDDEELVSSVNISNLTTQVDMLETHNQALKNGLPLMQQKIDGLCPKLSTLLLEKGTIEGDLHSAKVLQTDLQKEMEMLVHRH